jgi:hypothetical protein
MFLSLTLLLLKIEVVLRSGEEADEDRTQKQEKQARRK